MALRRLVLLLCFEGAFDLAVVAIGVASARTGRINSSGGGELGGQGKVVGWGKGGGGEMGQAGEGGSYSRRTKL